MGQEINGQTIQIVDRAQAHGLRVLGATLTPYADTVFPGCFTPEGETKRVAVNTWIRGSKAFDGVIDFDAVVRDPARPDHIQAQDDFGDHLHPLLDEKGFNLPCIWKGASSRDGLGAAREVVAAS